MEKTEIFKSPIVYLCNPKKNKVCDVNRRNYCHIGGHPQTKEMHGVCKFTDNPAYSLDGKKYRYNHKTCKHEEVK